MFISSNTVFKYFVWPAQILCLVLFIPQPITRLYFISMKTILAKTGFFSSFFWLFARINHSTIQWVFPDTQIHSVTTYWLQSSCCSAQCARPTLPHLWKETIIWPHIWRVDHFQQSRNDLDWWCWHKRIRRSSVAGVFNAYGLLLLTLIDIPTLEVHFVYCFAETSMFIPLVSGFRLLL